VEFADFQCPFSAKASKVVKELREKYGAKICFVFRQYPLTFHVNAHQAAEAALAAHAQGKFWEYHEMLFEWGSSSSTSAQSPNLTRETLDKYAQKVGLNLSRFKNALDNKEYAQKVDTDIKLGVDVKVSGTPTLFINGERVKNPADYESVAKSIDSALAGGVNQQHVGHGSKKPGELTAKHCRGVASPFFDRAMTDCP